MEYPPSKSLNITLSRSRDCEILSSISLNVPFGGKIQPDDDAILTDDDGTRNNQPIRAIVRHRVIIYITWLL